MLIFSEQITSSIQADNFFFKLVAATVREAENFSERMTQPVQMTSDQSRMNAKRASQQFLDMRTDSHVLCKFSPERSHLMSCVSVTNLFRNVSDLYACRKGRFKNHSWRERAQYFMYV